MEEKKFIKDEKFSDIDNVCVKHFKDAYGMNMVAIYNGTEFTPHIVDVVINECYHPYYNMDGRYNGIIFLPRFVYQRVFLDSYKLNNMDYGHPVPVFEWGSNEPIAVIGGKHYTES